MNRILKLMMIGFAGLWASVSSAEVTLSGIESARALYNCLGEAEMQNGTRVKAGEGFRCMEIRGPGSSWAEETIVSCTLEAEFSVHVGGSLLSIHAPFGEAGWILNALYRACDLPERVLGNGVIEKGSDSPFLKLQQRESGVVLQVVADQGM